MFNQMKILIGFGFLFTQTWYDADFPSFC